MPSSGKPAFNPFATGHRPIGDGGAPAAAPGTPFRRRRGISRIATESRLEEISFKRATVLSMVLHILSPVAAVILSLLVLLILSWLMHFNFWDFFKPKTAPADIEFTLVRESDVAPPEKPLFKGNANQHAGGKRIENQPLKAVEEPPQSAPAKPAETKSQPQPVQAVTQPMAPEPPQPKVQPKKIQAAKAPEKPAFKATVPIPRPPEPSQDIGPVVKAGASSSSASGPTSTQIASTSGSSLAGTGTSSSSQVNSQGGKGDAGVDVMKDVDFGPFMADLERRIKRNWVPPRGSESRRVKLLFYLARDGRVVKIETSGPSGDEEADRAAIAAVQISAPFMAFPPQVREDILPVEFTFDYNVLNPKHRR